MQESLLQQAMEKATLLRANDGWSLVLSEKKCLAYRKDNTIKVQTTLVGNENVDLFDYLLDFQFFTRARWDCALEGLEHVKTIEDNTDEYLVKFNTLENFFNNGKRHRIVRRFFKVNDEKILVCCGVHNAANSLKIGLYSITVQNNSVITVAFDFESSSELFGVGAFFNYCNTYLMLNATINSLVALKQLISIRKFNDENAPPAAQQQQQQASRNSVALSADIPLHEREYFKSPQSAIERKKSNNKPQEEEQEKEDADESLTNTKRGALLQKRASSSLRELNINRSANDHQPLDYSYTIPSHYANTIEYYKPTGKETSLRDSTYYDLGADADKIFVVRGATYLQDKVKIPSRKSAMEYVAQFYYLTKDGSCVRKIISDPDGIIAKQHAGRSDRPFLFIINFLVPGFGNSVHFFARRRDANGLAEADDPVFDQMMSDFVNGDDEYRKQRLKIIPNVPKGNFIVKKTVGNTPAIIGNKLGTEYFKGDNCFEVQIDIGSSQVAKGILSVVLGYASSMDLDLAFLFEAKSEEELPERILGAIRAHHPCLVKKNE